MYNTQKQHTSLHVYHTCNTLVICFIVLVFTVTSFFFLFFFGGGGGFRTIYIFYTLAKLLTIVQEFNFTKI